MCETAIETENLSISISELSNNDNQKKNSQKLST